MLPSTTYPWSVYQSVRRNDQTMGRIETEKPEICGSCYDYPPNSNGSQHHVSWHLLAVDYVSFCRHQPLSQPVLFNRDNILESYSSKMWIQQIHEPRSQVRPIQIRRSRISPVTRGTGDSVNHNGHETPSVPRHAARPIGRNHAYVGTGLRRRFLVVTVGLPRQTSAGYTSAMDYGSATISEHIWGQVHHC